MVPEVGRSRLYCRLPHANKPAGAGREACGRRLDRLHVDARRTASLPPDLEAMLERAPRDLAAAEAANMYAQPRRGRCPIRICGPRRRSPQIFRLCFRQPTTTNRDRKELVRTPVQRAVGSSSARQSTSLRRSTERRGRGHGSACLWTRMRIDALRSWLRRAHRSGDVHESRAGTARHKIGKFYGQQMPFT